MKDPGISDIHNEEVKTFVHTSKVSEKKKNQDFTVDH